VRGVNDVATGEEAESLGGDGGEQEGLGVGERLQGTAHEKHAAGLVDDLLKMHGRVQQHEFDRGRILLTASCILGGSGVSWLCSSLGRLLDTGAMMI
jgi:hypothetical protein